MKESILYYRESIQNRMCIDSEFHIIGNRLSPRFGMQMAKTSNGFWIFRRSTFIPGRWRGAAQPRRSAARVISATCLYGNGKKSCPGGLNLWRPHSRVGLARFSPVPQSPKPCTGTEPSVLKIFSLSVLSPSVFFSLFQSMYMFTSWFIAENG